MDQTRRLNIFGSILDTVARLENLGIIQWKVDPSNIIIAEGDRVVMTDFSRADVMTYHKLGIGFQEHLDKPCMPHNKWHASEFMEFAGWYPREWIDDNELFEQWGDRHYNHDDYTSLEETLKETVRLGWDSFLENQGFGPEKLHVHDTSNWHCVKALAAKNNASLKTAR